MCRFIQITFPFNSIFPCLFPIRDADDDPEGAKLLASMTADTLGEASKLVALLVGVSNSLSVFRFVC